MKNVRRILLLFLVLIMAFELNSCFIVFNDKDAEDSGTEGGTLPAPAFFPYETVLDRDVVMEAIDPAASAIRQTLAKLDTDPSVPTAVTVTCVTGKDMFECEDDGSAYSRALTLRNEILKGYTGATALVQEKTFDEMISEARTAKFNETYYTDVVCVPQNQIALLLGQNMLMNLKTLYDSDFSAEWYDPESCDQLAAGTYSYAVAGDGIFCPENVYCLYFNKKLASVFNFDLYKSVKDGEWTVDRMNEYISGVLSYESDVYGFGYACDPSTFSNVMYTATGMKYVDTSFGKRPSLIDNDENTDAFVASVKKLLATEDRVCLTGSPEEIRKAFVENKLLFYMDKLTAMEELTNTFGILPVPKYFNDGGYTTYLDEFAPVFVVLNSNNTLENTGKFLNYFNASSGTLLKEGYVRDCLDKFLRDESSADMLDIILENTRYDFTTVFGASYGSIANPTYKAVSQAIFGDTPYSTIKARAANAFNNEAARSFS